MLSHIKHQHQFQPTDDAIGNLTLGRGTLWGSPARVAIVESLIASGSLGVAECEALARLFTDIAKTGEPLILFLDCAGARVSEGLPALGAFRRMFAEALALDAAQLVAYCGKNCFGGGSMLASCAAIRVLSADTRFAMSGPAIIAGAAEPPLALGEVNTAIGYTARLNFALGNLAALAPLETQTPLHQRLSTVFTKAEITAARVEVQGGTVREIHLTDGLPMTAVGTFALADALWAMRAAQPSTLRIFIDCPSHAATLTAERQFLSAQLANLALALHALRAAGTVIETVVTGTLGGGVYVALAASTRVLLTPGASIHLLPGKAMAAILGETTESKAAASRYLESGVADGSWTK